MRIAVVVFAATGALLMSQLGMTVRSTNHSESPRSFSIQAANAHDLSAPLRDLASEELIAELQRSPSPVPTPPDMKSPLAAASVEQRSQGNRPAATIVASFDGLGVGFKGPQGTANLRNPSDNSLAVGPDHIFQIVNVRMAIYSKKGKKFSETGRVLYGPVATNTVFKGFGGACESINNGDAVVRYDQLANRWLIVMPTFRRGPVRPDQPKPGHDGEPAQVSVLGQKSQPGSATPLFVPTPSATPAPPQPRGQPTPPQPQGPFSMCYAVSTSSDPLGSYYRYEFLRALFPDYPRPAVWPDGYYIPTSTGDEVIQKHACVAEREKMLKGEPASEQCVIIDGVNFLNNADLDGHNLPPRGAPNIIMAAGGAQLKNVLADDQILVWKVSCRLAESCRYQSHGPREN